MWVVILPYTPSGWCSRVAMFPCSHLLVGCFCFSLSFSLFFVVVPSFSPFLALVLLLPLLYWFLLSPPVSTSVLQLPCCFSGGSFQSTLAGWAPAATSGTTIRCLGPGVCGLSVGGHQGGSAKPGGNAGVVPPVRSEGGAVRRKKKKKKK